MYDDDFDDGLADPMAGHDLGALEAGMAYAGYRLGQDAQTARLVDAIEQIDIATPTIDVHIHTDDEDRPGIAPINALDFSTADMPPDLDSFIGQDPLKRQIMVRIKSAQTRNAPLEHMLLASGYPGVGKTTVARLVAKIMGKQIIELVPPFNIYTLVDAASQLEAGDILFIDEIHKLADSGKRGAEILLKVLEDHVAYMPDGEVVQLNPITVIGATTDRDKLPEPVVDRFKIKPYFQAYDKIELGRIAIQFAFRREAENYVDDRMALAISKACRGTPRIIEEMVMACRDIAVAFGTVPSPADLLEFLEVEPDGLTRTHIHYLTALRQYFGREARDGSVEYIVGEAAIQQILRETKQGIGRVERFLVERGLVDRTPRGRRLTPLGIARAEEFIDAGKGAADVA